MRDAPGQLKAGHRRALLVLLPGLLLAVIFILAFEPIPQPESYHRFADKRVLFQIPHAGDVLSNLALIIVGGLGLRVLSRSYLYQGMFFDGRERHNFQWLFAGVFLAGFGSAWYHLSPDNDSLVWDRLPMTMAFMGVLAALLCERVSLSLGIALLRPLLLLGVASVLWWIWTEHQGHGDLRWYLIVQFYPLITMVPMLLFLPSSYTHDKYYWGVLICYAMAKLVELQDKQIFEFTHGLISGHNLKHLFAALAAALLLAMLRVRTIRVK